MALAMVAGNTRPSHRAVIRASRSTRNVVGATNSELPHRSHAVSAHEHWRVDQSVVGAEFTRRSTSSDFDQPDPSTKATANASSGVLRSHASDEDQQPAGHIRVIRPIGGLLAGINEREKDGFRTYR